MPRPLTICLVTQEFPPQTNWGGVGVQFENLALASAKAGHRVVVISRVARGAPAFEHRPSGLEVFRIGVPLNRRMLVGRTFDRILHARSVLSKVRELDRRYGFDVIEATEANLEAERLVADPVFLERTVIACHGGNLQGQPVEGALAPVHRLDFQWSCQREHDMLRQARTIVVSSEATRNVILGHGVDPARIHLIPLGIDTDRFHPAPSAEAGRPLQVGFVGRLQERKGLDFVWRVMERLGPDAGIQFQFKGAIHPATRADTLSRLEQFASFARYHPPGGTEEMPAFMRSLDVLLLPSRFENFGLTYAEAMASGLVVFAGHGGGGPEMVTDGRTGFLVDPDGPVDSVVTRLEALAADRSAFGDMRQLAREEIVRRFSLDRFAAGKADLYRTLRASSDVPVAVRP